MEYLDADEAADFLGVTPATLYSYVSRGLVESVEVESDSRRRKYRKSDLQRLRRKKTAQRKEGPDAADALNWGTPSLETSIAEIGPRGPSYRGERLRAIVDDEWRFAEVASWLWEGERTDWTPAEWEGTTAARPERFGRRGSTEALRMAVELASTNPAYRGADGPVDAARRLTAASIATLGEIAPELSPPTGRLPSLAGRVGALFDDRRDTAVDLFGTTLAVVAEHGLNASAFAGRVAASTGAEIHASVVAALATFSGPRHGGQSTRLRELLHELDGPEEAADLVESRLEAGRALPGFGHPLYEHGDPRYRLLEEAVGGFDGPSDRPERVATLEALVDAAEASGVAAPNLDAGLVLVAETLDLPMSTTPLVFACGRMAGWIAHALEQRQRDVLLRPRSEYVDP